MVAFDVYDKDFPEVVNTERDDDTGFSVYCLSDFGFAGCKDTSRSTLVAQYSSIVVQSLIIQGDSQPQRCVLLWLRLLLLLSWASNQAFACLDADSSESGDSDKALLYGSIIRLPHSLLQLEVISLM